MSRSFDYSGKGIHPNKAYRTEKGSVFENLGAGLNLVTQDSNFSRNLMHKKSHPTYDNLPTKQSTKIRTGPKNSARRFYRSMAESDGQVNEESTVFDIPPDSQPSMVNSRQFRRSDEGKPRSRPRIRSKKDDFGTGNSRDFGDNRSQKTASRRSQGTKRRRKDSSNLMGSHDRSQKGSKMVVPYTNNSSKKIQRSLGIIDADSTVELVRDNMKLQNENFGLKQEIEKIKNFREIGEIEIRKLRKTQELLVKERDDLQRDVRRQRGEISRLKKFEKTDVFSANSPPPDIIPDNLDASDWQSNQAVYLKYLNFLKSENESLESENQSLKQQLDEEVQANARDNNIQLSSHSETSGFVKPGGDYIALSKTQMNSLYAKVLHLMQQYKSELDLLFDSLHKQAKQHLKNQDDLKSEFEKKIGDLNRKLEFLTEQKNYEDMYKMSVEKVKMLEFEMEALSKHVGQLLEGRKKVKDDFRLEIEDLKKKELRLVETIGEVQEKEREARNHVDELQRKLGRYKALYKMMGVRPLRKGEELDEGQGGSVRESVGSGRQSGGGGGTPGEFRISRSRRGSSSRGRTKRIMNQAFNVEL